MAPHDEPAPLRALPLLLAGGLVLSACTDSAGTVPSAESSTGGGDGGGGGVGDVTDGAALPPRLDLDVPDPDSVYDPFFAGEELPDGYRQTLVRDAIAPVYDPMFTTADGVDWPEDSLVIGVDLDGEARAYPVGFLNRREIVNDNHRGIPTLVTW